MSLFGDNDGKVVALSKTGFPALVELSGITGTSQMLVMSVGFGQAANVQFMHTLQDAIYVYSFGERMGAVKVSGLLIFRACSVGSTARGLPKLMKYYKTNSVSLNSRPIKISMANQALKGFLTGIEVGSFDARMGTAQFALNFASLPVT